MLIILSAVTIKTVTDLKIIEFSIKGTEDYSKAQDKEIEEFGKIENLLIDTINNIESGNTGEESKGPIIPTNVDIGKYVNYVPVGTAYTVEAKYSGHSSHQVFSQDADLKWQIWKVENDILYLISEGLPSIGGYDSKGSLLLSGARAYNNGVTLLDNICQANYGISGNINIEAQNLKLEDVLSVKADGIEPELEYETQSYTYPETGALDFPSIWYNNERESFSLAINNRSVAYPLVESEDETIEASNQKLYYTKWLNLQMNNAEAWKNEKYYNMDINPGKNSTYWLSSRYVCPRNTTFCYFGLQIINSGGISSSDYLYKYESGKFTATTYPSKIRPLVKIPLTACEITRSETILDTFDITITK